jgi:hypothetical protein
VFCAVSATAAIAMDRGQFANVPPEVREWFEHLRSPNGVPCCSYADGHRTGYETRQDEYWVPIEGEWYPVPPEAIISGSLRQISSASRPWQQARHSVPDWPDHVTGDEMVAVRRASTRLQVL